MPLSARSSSIRRRSLAAGAAAGAAMVSLRALARPLPGTERRLLDWDAVRRVALARCDEDSWRPAAIDAERLGRRYDAMAAELAPLMAEVCGAPVSGFPHFTVVDRRGFIDRNLVIVQRLFEPIERLRATIPESRATALGRNLLSRYVGELFGFLSKRVLGQYDPVLMLAPTAQAADNSPPTALYLVEPNVVAFQRRHAIPEENLRRWLVLHELTHAWQFESHPWLGEHLTSLMSELLLSQLVAQTEQAGAGDGQPRTSTRVLLRALPGTLRAQLRAIGSVQATMSVCEGYSNFVMHRVGSRHLADFERLESAFHARSTQRPLLERLVLAITGLNMKMRQYELGEHFAETVSTRGGLPLLNRVWEAPALMPTMAELQAPERWIQRVGG
jgi:coenzyme F420 biosynthesis associated uncharacterized protein